MTWTIGKVLAIISFILALLGVLNVAANVPLIPIAVLVLAIAVVVG